jgi:hypothetical protein
MRLEIDRDRKVRLEPSFHFETLDRAAPKLRRSPFVVELVNEAGRTVSVHRLGSACFHCGPESWPKRLQAQVRFPPGVRRLNVVEGDKVLLTYEVEPAPKVEVSVEWRDRRHVVSWKADPGDGCTFLLQWQGADGIWRGLAPRTQEREFTLPDKLPVGKGRVKMRVLATRGIATGSAEFEVDHEGRSEGEIVVNQTGDVLVATIIGAGARAEILWFDEHGGQIGSGRQLDLRALPQRPNVVRAAAVNESVRVAPISVVRTTDESGKPVWQVIRERLAASTNVDKHPGKPDHKHESDQSEPPGTGKSD